MACGWRALAAPGPTSAAAVAAPSTLGAAAATILAAAGVNLAYRRKGAPAQVVLRDFSLELGAGEVIALLGPSGVGKSTLLRVLAGLQRPDGGGVRVFGRALRAPHPAVSVMFQDPCLLPWKTVRGNVAVGVGLASQPAASAGERRARVEATLAEVGLEDVLDQYPAKLSGGMAQRVALARCLVRRPSILLLDEPFAALDVVNRAAMQALLLREVRRHAAAAVLVTHDVDEALRVADRVLVLRGRPAVLAGCWTAPGAPGEAVRPVPAALRERVVAALAERVPAPIRESEPEPA